MLPMGASPRPTLRLLIPLAVLVACAGCGRTGPEDQGLRLASPAFGGGGEIPSRYTCEGGDLSPPLEWSGAPAGTESFALIVDDPDAPGTAVHWVVYNIPATATELAESEGGRVLPAGTREGLNDFGRTRYGGPCPPAGRHRYVHKLYALDTLLPDLGSPGKRELARAMEGHVLAEARLIGTYELGAGG